MSHFCCYVFVKEPRDVERQVDKLMAPYCEIDDNYARPLPVDEEYIRLVMKNGTYKSVEEFAADYGYVIDQNGHVCRWANPDARWDYYNIREFLPTRNGAECAMCFVKELPDPIDEKDISYSMVTSDGVWDERGRVYCGTLGDHTEESTEEYEKRFLKYVKEHQDEIVVSLDCHI